MYIIANLAIQHKLCWPFTSSRHNETIAGLSTTAGQALAAISRRARVKIGRPLVTVQTVKPCANRKHRKPRKENRFHFLLNNGVPFQFNISDKLFGFEPTTAYKQAYPRSQSQRVTIEQKQEPSFNFQLTSP